MTVRLIQPYNGQAVNTLYTGPDEAILKGSGNADDRVEEASDYATYKLKQQAARLAPSLQAGGYIFDDILGGR